MKLQTVLTAAGLSLSLVLAGCNGDRPTAATTESAPANAETTSAPAPTGEVIEVKMVTDGAGNYFEPAEITASEGDVLRFVLVSGVHNVSFPAAENPNDERLPEASAYLQLAGQTHDIVVDLPAGEYDFQCDPHVPLGMLGTLTVQ